MTAQRLALLGNAAYDLSKNQSVRGRMAVALRYARHIFGSPNIALRLKPNLYLNGKSAVHKEPSISSVRIKTSHNGASRRHSVTRGADNVLWVPLRFRTGRYAQYLGAFEVVRPKSSLPYAEADLRLFDRFAETVAASVHNSAHLADIVRSRRHLLDYRRQNLKMLHAASRVQSAFLQSHLPLVPGFDMAVRSESLDAVGGDFYEVLEVPGSRRVEIFVGDVVGHGLPAALVMALTSGLLGEIGLTARSPGQILTRAGRDIRKFISQSDIRYVTLGCAVLDVRSRCLRVARAGHEPPLLFRRKTATCETVTTDGSVLGLFEDEVFRERRVILRPGDILVFYTDGIVETRNRKGEFFPLKTVEEIVGKHSDMTARELVEKIFEEVNRFAAGRVPRDDRTVFILKAEKKPVVKKTARRRP